MSSLPNREHQARNWLNAANVLALALIILCIVLQMAGLDLVLRYDRAAIAGGEWWSLLSGNFVHLGTAHLMMNLAGFVLVALLVWSHFNALEWAFVLFFCALCITLGLYLWNPEVLWYVGLSGILHGVLVAGCLADIKLYPRSAVTLLLLVFLKLGWEQFSGAVPGSVELAGGNVVVDAHLYGAISGAAAGMLLLGRRRLFDTGQVQRS